MNEIKETFHYDYGRCGWLSYGFFFSHYLLHLIALRKIAWIFYPFYSIMPRVYFKDLVPAEYMTNERIKCTYNLIYIPSTLKKI